MARILVIDDDEDLRILTTELFEDLGHEVIAAANGIEGLARAFNEQPDVLILDGLLPDMDGLKILETLRVHPAGKDLPVLFLSGLEDPEIRRRIAELGADATLIKPAHLEDIINAVERLLGA